MCPPPSSQIRDFIHLSNLSQCSSLLPAFMSLWPLLLILPFFCLAFNPVPKNVECLVNCSRTNGICVHLPDSSAAGKSGHTCLCVGPFEPPDCSIPSSPTVPAPDLNSPAVSVPEPSQPAAPSPDLSSPAAPNPGPHEPNASQILAIADLVLKAVIAILLAAILFYCLCKPHLNRLRRRGAFRFPRPIVAPTPPIVRWSRRANRSPFDRRRSSPSAQSIEAACSSRQPPTTHAPSLSRRLTAPVQPRLPFASAQPVAAQLAQPVAAQLAQPVAAQLAQPVAVQPIQPAQPIAQRPIAPTPAQPVAVRPNCAVQ
jgi:hypothetical protein